MAVVEMPGLERRLKAELTGEVMFDRFTRGRYALSYDPYAHRSTNTSPTTTTTTTTTDTAGATGATTKSPANTAPRIP